MITADNRAIAEKTYALASALIEESEEENDIEEARSIQ